MPDQIQLDSVQDNILYERPLLDEKFVTQELSVFDHALILSLIRHLKATSPIDDVQREYVLAYSNKNLEKFKNWSVFTKTLIVRSVEEFGSFKKRERAIVQLEQLGKDWNSGDAPLSDRMRYLWALDFPSFIELQMIQVEKYNSIGLFMSSCLIYEQLEMYEEAVEAYFASNHKDRAKNLAEKLLEEEPSPKLYAILGDIYKDPSYYHKAIEASNGSYARAYRSLGHYYYNNK